MHEAHLLALVDGIFSSAEKDELPRVAKSLVSDHLKDLISRKLAARVLVAVGEDDEEDTGGSVLFAHRGESRARFLHRAGDSVEERRRASRHERHTAQTLGVADVGV